MKKSWPKWETGFCVHQNGKKNCRALNDKVEERFSSPEFHFVYPSMCVYGRCKIYDIGIWINSSSFVVAFFSYLLDAVSYAFFSEICFLFFLVLLVLCLIFLMSSFKCLRYWGVFSSALLKRNFLDLLCNTLKFQCSDCEYVFILKNLKANRIKSKSATRAKFDWKHKGKKQISKWLRTPMFAGVIK